MPEQLSQMQARIHTMREAVLEAGSMAPRENDRITIPDLVEKNFLWYLDRLKAAVAGSQQDKDFSGPLKWLRTEIDELWHQDFGWFPDIIKDDEYTRKDVESWRKVCEILFQLEMLTDEVRDTLHAIKR